MHNLFLGELRHHCRDVWGIDVKDKATSSKTTPHTPTEQAEWLSRLVDALRQGVLPNGALAKGALSVVTQPRKGYLVALAQANGISPTSKATKQAYAALLLEWAQTHPIDQLVIPPVLPKATSDFHLASNQHDISKFRVLTPEVVGTLRADMSTTFLPSWIERPPANFGSPAHGKLKADHWRTVCTISMTITLVRLWSSSASTAGDRQILQNFVHLVIAVDLATRRSMDPERARLFDHHMAEYLRTLRELFDHNLVPNHHLSLHLTACLLLFGPVRGWWGYPFERYNGMIQRLNTNNHIAEIPLTFMRLFYAGAELRWMMSSTEWPDSEEMRAVVEAFDRTYQDVARGSRVLDIFGSTMSPSTEAINEQWAQIFSNLRDTRMDNDIYANFVSLIGVTCGPKDFTTYHADFSDQRARLAPHMRTLTQIDVGRVSYGCRSSHVRNSFVCFKDLCSTDPTRIRAGQISLIFLHARVAPGEHRVVQPFIVIEEYVPLTAAHAECDPYRRFPLLDTKLYYNRFHPRRVIVRSDDIIAHFAAFVYIPEGIRQSCIVVRSLDRVRPSTHSWTYDSDNLFFPLELRMDPGVSVETRHVSQMAELCFESACSQEDLDSSLSRSQLWRSSGSLALAGSS
ncbi:hypothetical protein C2E23DRAFT_743933 [Lenzites betulinus]|nr:hypothetical protein C2E23DRAFT_743933 [Lenzites betulinus]